MGRKDTKVYLYQGELVRVIRRDRCGCECPNCPKPVTQVKIEEINGKWDTYCKPLEISEIRGKY